MRRKSERNKSKSTSEKRSSDTSSRKTRRTSRRRKRSTSHSSSDDSDDAPLKPAVVEVETQAEVSPPSNEPKISGSNSDEDKQEEEPIWKVKTTDASSGEIQKLKICLQRPPTTPERTEKSPRRRRGQASSQSDDASLTPDEKPHKRKTKRGSPTTQGSSIDNSAIEDAEKDECLIIVKETNEVIIGKGKLDCSQPSQETENEECIQDSRTEVQADESVIESKIEQDMGQDSAPIVKDACKLQEQQSDDKIGAEQEEAVIETTIVKQIEEKQIDTSERNIKNTEHISDQPMEVQEMPQPEQPIRSREIHIDKKADSKSEVIEEMQEIKVEQEQKIEDITKSSNVETSNTQIHEVTSESNEQQQTMKKIMKSVEEAKILFVKESKQPEEESVTEVSEFSHQPELETKAELKQQQEESVETKLETLHTEEKSEIISSEKKSEIVSAEEKSKTIPIEEKSEIVSTEEKSEIECAEVKSKISSSEEIVPSEKISEIISSEEKSETVSSEEKLEIVSSEEKSETVSSEQKIADEEPEISSTKESEICSKEFDLSSKYDSTNEVEVTKTEEVKQKNIKDEEEISSNEEDKMEENPVEENKSLEIKEFSEKDLNSKPASPETQMTSYDEKIEEDEHERIISTRNWGKYKAILIEEQPITFSVIQSLFPSVKMLNLEDVKLETEEPIKETKVVKKEREVTVQSSSSPKEEDSEKEVSTIGLNRKISIVNDEASKLQPPPSPAKNPISSVLYITNLVRPFTIKQLQELLSRTGKIVEDGFWTDKIKSKCYVQYETDEEAEATRNALHGVQWPTGNGKKLIIDFGTPESMASSKNAIVEPAAKPVVEKPVEKVPEYKKEEPVTEDDRWEKSRAAAPTREWDLGKITQDNRDRSRSRDRNQARSDRSDKKRPPRIESPSNGDHLTPRKKKKEDAEVKMMDDLFHKTKATPSIYWLPLSPEQIAKKQQQRLQRMAEHKRRMEESRRMERGFGRGGVRSRRRSARYDGD